MTVVTDALCSASGIITFDCVFCPTQHVRCESHREFVRNRDNYASLDSMISQGPNLERFLEDAVKYQDQHSAEGQAER